MSSTANQASSTPANDHVRREGISGMTAAIDPVRTIGRLPFHAAEEFGDQPAQRFKHDGEWLDLSHVELAVVVDELSRGLISLGIQPGDRVAVLSETRPEWMQAAYAIAAAGGVVVPIYPSSSPEECDWVLRDSGAVAVVCEDATQGAKVRAVPEPLPDLVHVLTIDPQDGCIDLAALRASGREQDPATRADRTEAIAEDGPAIIIYTSGTTGRPKGCVLTHRNLLACARQAMDLGFIHSDDVAYLFLPLAHVFAQTVSVAATAVGYVVAYLSDGTAGILADLAEVRPTYFPSVPRIFEKVYSAFAGAPRTDEVYAQVRAVFGGRLRVAITGAAPIAPEILEFFFAAGVAVYEGYGLSESTSYATVNTPDAVRIGSIGPAMPFGEVAVAEDGEILLRGPHVFAGYWNNPQATAEALTEDGWLLTGDLGRIDDDGFVHVTGRKKEIIITAGGKNISPADFENELRQSPFVSHVVMHGDRRPYPVALITLDAEYVIPWAAAQGRELTAADLADDDRVREEVRAVVDRANARLATVAQVKRFTILAEDFSQAAGELTPTLKMKRKVIVINHAEELDRLYQEG